MLKPSVQIHNVDGIMVAEFWECLRLDPAPVQELRKHYELHVQKRGRPEIVVDLSGVDFAGSAALGNFMALHRLVRQNGGRIVFSDVSATVAEVFRVSKLEALFDFVPDRASAVHAIIEHPGADKTDRRPVERDPDPPQNPIRSGISRLRRRNAESDPH